MRLSTSTNTFSYRLNGEYVPYKESIQRLKAVGYDVVDINFCQSINGKSDLFADDWQKRMEDLREEAERIGIEFSQSHPVFVGGHLHSHSEERQERYHEMMRRSMIASSILGVKWAVLHPMPAKDNVLDVDESIQENMKMHHEAVEVALKHNVGVAYENMIEGPKTKRRFSSHADELVALIDAYNDDRIGACWDFGHGNFLYKDQRLALRTLGKRLKALHVNDNDGTGDYHMFPFHGTIDWYSVLPVLAEIGYEGDFTYETHREFGKLPEHLKDPLAKVGLEIGEHCLNIVAGNAKKTE